MRSAALSARTMRASRGPLSDPGVFPTGALALAISPRDTNHLLLATDSGVWRSRNGGRDWDVEARDLVTGAAFAVAFDVDGERALIAGVSGLFGNKANPVAADPGSRGSCARARARRRRGAGASFLAGRYGLYRSDDWGCSWVDVAGSFKSAPVDALLVSSGDAGAVYALVSGSVWSSVDGAKTWQQRSEGLGGEGKVETLGIDPSNPARLWVVAASNVLVSEDRGASWQPRRQPGAGSRCKSACDRGVGRRDAGRNQSWCVPQRRRRPALGGSERKPAARTWPWAFWSAMHAHPPRSMRASR